MQMRVLALALLAAVSAAQSTEIPVSEYIRHEVKRDVSMMGASGEVSRYYEGYYDVTETVYEGVI